MMAAERILTIAAPGRFRGSAALTLAKQKP
jgi:hypothetical protein